MLTISKALSAKQAKNYYQKDYSQKGELSFSNSTADSLVGGEEAKLIARDKGIWHGKLAEGMGLEGAVKTEYFERLCDGVHPFTEKQLVRHAPVKTYTNRFGREITTMGHRAGWDLTFSAPKSVSLAATVGGDDRIRQAHRQSVKTALNELEKSVEARIGGNNPARQTGKMVSALFEHDTARPDKTFGYAAPQLHTHSVTFNLTETEKGISKPLQPLEIYRSQKYATAVYRVELADKLQKLGYEIEINQKTKAPEIKGFDAAYLRENSVRGAEIQKETAAVREKFELGGGKVGNDAGIRQIAAWQGRTGKNFDYEEMRSRSLELEVKYDFQAQRIYQQALSDNSYQYEQSGIRENAVKAIDFAKEAANNISLDSQAKMLNERQFLTAALEKGIGQTNFDAIKENFSTRQAAGEFSNLISQNYEKEQMKEITQENAGQQVQQFYQNGNATTDIEKAVGKTENTQSRDIQADNSLKAEQGSVSAKNSESDSPEKIAEEKADKKLSMDALEKSIRQEIAAENEIAQGAEILLAL